MSNQKFLIWSNEHGQWWRASNNGYTEDRKEAGAYSLGEALQICEDADYWTHSSFMEAIVPVSEGWTK